MEEQEIELIDYLRVIWRRKVLIILGTLVCMISAAIVSLRMPAIYQATATLLISKPQLQVKLESQIETPLIQDRSIPTFMDLVKTRRIVEEVINKLGLKSDSKPMPPEELMAKAQVKDLKNTDLIELRIEDTDPQRAAMIANTWAELFIKHLDQIYLKDIKDTGSFVQERLKEATTNLKAIEVELEDFNKKNRIELLTSQVEERSKKLVALELRKADLLDEVKTQGDGLRDNLYYLTTQDMLNIRAETYGIIKDFSRGLDQLITTTKIGAQAALMELYSRLRQKISRLLEGEVLRLSKAITDLKLSHELEAKRQAIRLKELGIFAERGSTAEKDDPNTVMFEAHTKKESVRSLIPSRLDPIYVTLKQERIVSEIDMDIMEAQIARYQEIIGQLRQAREKIKSEWQDFSRTKDMRRGMDRIVKEFQDITKLLDITLVEFSGISSITEKDLAELQDMVLEITRNLDLIEKGKILEKEIMIVLQRKSNFQTFGEDSNEALITLQRFPLIANTDYIKGLSDARLRFLRLRGDLEQIENLRTFLETELRDKGTDIGSIVSIVEEVLSQLSTLGTNYGAEARRLILKEPGTGEAEINAGGAGGAEMGSLAVSRERSLLNSLMSFKTLAIKLRVAADSINDLNSELSGLKTQFASEQLRQVQLQRQVETARDTYSVLNKKWEEIKISRESKIGMIKLAKAAFPPEHRIKPKRRQNTMLAGAVGLMVTVFLAFFLEYLQTATLKKTDQIDQTQ